MEYNTISIDNFLEELSSSKPVPGGGGAAALASGLACALSNMVFNLTVGKKQYNSMDQIEQRNIDLALKYCENKLGQFIQYINKDADTFMNLMSSYKLPKETDEQLKTRKEKINLGLQMSMMVPFELAERTLELMDYIFIAAEKGNVNVVSDAGVAAIMADAAIESCILNIKINLNFMELDEKSKNEIVSKYIDIEKNCKKMKDKIMEVVNSKI